MTEKTAQRNEHFCPKLRPEIPPGSIEVIRKLVLLTVGVFTAGERTHGTNTVFAIATEETSDHTFS